MTYVSTTELVRPIVLSSSVSNRLSYRLPEFKLVRVDSDHALKAIVDLPFKSSKSFAEGRLFSTLELCEYLNSGSSVPVRSDVVIQLAGRFSFFIKPSIHIFREGRFIYWSQDAFYRMRYLATQSLSDCWRFNLQQSSILLGLDASTLTQLIQECPSLKLGQMEIGNTTLLPRYLLAEIDLYLECVERLEDLCSKLPLVDLSDRLYWLYEAGYPFTLEMQQLLDSQMRKEL